MSFKTDLFQIKNKLNDLFYISQFNGKGILKEKI